MPYKCVKWTQINIITYKTLFEKIGVIHNLVLSNKYYNIFLFAFIKFRNIIYWYCITIIQLLSYLMNN